MAFDEPSILSSQEPFTLFAQWLKEAKAHSGIREPTAMTVATQGVTGELHARVVLLKGFDPSGFVFYTNYQSQKGQDLDHNRSAAAVFYWDPMARQVKISGTVEKTTRQESEQYWKTRPRESQLSQWISKQSQAVSSRERMEEELAAARKQFEGQEVPCPEHWGGYRLNPVSIEFWLGRPNRLHDRFRFDKSDTGSWTVHRLYP